MNARSEPREAKPGTAVGSQGTDACRWAASCMVTHIINFTCNGSNFSVLFAGGPAWS